MTRYGCGNCRQPFLRGEGAPEARFCPYCGSSSIAAYIQELDPVVHEAAQRAVREAKLVEDVKAIIEDKPIPDVSEVSEEAAKPRRQAKR